MGSKGKEGASRKVDKKSQEVKKSEASNFEVASACNATIDRILEASGKSNKKKKKKSKMTIENEVDSTNNYVVKRGSNEKEKSQKRKKRKLELHKGDEGSRKKDKRTNVGKDVSNNDEGASKVKEALNEKKCEGGEENEMPQTYSGKDVRINDELKAIKKKKKKRKESRNKDGFDKDVSSNDEGAGKVKEALNEKMCKGGEENEMLQALSGKDVRINDELKAIKKKKKKGRESRNKDGFEKDVSNDDEGADKVKEALNEKMCKGGEENEMLQAQSGKDVRNDNELIAIKKRKKKRKEGRSKDGFNNVSSSEEFHENTGVEISKKEQIAKTRNLKEDDTEKKKVKKRKKDKEVDAIGESTPGDQNTMKKSKSVKDGSKGGPRVDISEEIADGSDKSKLKGKSKRVSFTDNVEVLGEDIEEDGFVRGKWFSKEEDQMVMEAVSNYIEEHGLGEEGLNKILKCSQYPEVKNCWKDIGASLPWRPSESIYYRAHVLFERDESRKWTDEEFEMIKKHYEKHGADWKQLAEELGKHRFHVKDAWRRIKLPNMKKGRWSQDEYQSLFDLVSLDLRMKAFGTEQKKSKHGMLRDNICWGAISDKLSTRTNATCCTKWYKQLTSPMVAEGLWEDSDDYRLLEALYSLDACCIEDVDWDNLLDHRLGDLCRKRWSQMIKHIGEHGKKSFAEQVEVLSKRYCPELLEARVTYDNKTTIP